MADTIDVSGLPKSSGWAWTDSGTITPLTADNGVKLKEMANSINWGASAFETTTDIMPTDFGALTNGSYSTSMNTALQDLGKQWEKGFSTLTNGMGAAEIASLLAGYGAQGGGVSEFGVKLVSKVTGETVLFKVMPTISESRAAVYDDVMMPHHPGLIAKYNHSAPRTWSIGSIKLISRTTAEADENQRIINTLRGWLMPYYGSGTEISAPDLFGAPPDLLEFTAYGDHNIGKIPVVLENAGWDWPNDVDWIHTSTGEPFPVILHIGQLSLKEAWSPREYSGFDLEAYRQGNLAGAYIPAVYAPLDTAKPETTTAGAANADTSQSGIKTTEPAVTATGEKPIAVQPKDTHLPQKVSKSSAAIIPSKNAAKAFNNAGQTGVKNTVVRDSAFNLGMPTTSGLSKSGIF